jgi:hypothetical protein
MTEHSITNMKLNFNIVLIKLEPYYQFAGLTQSFSIKGCKAANRYL